MMLILLALTKKLYDDSVTGTKCMTITSDTHNMLTLDVSSSILITSNSERSMEDSVSTDTLLTKVQNNRHINTMIRNKTNLIKNHIHSQVISSRSYGDLDYKKHIWAQYGYSYGKKRPEKTSFGFNVDAQAYAFGIDASVNNNTLGGLAYSFTKHETNHRTPSRKHTIQTGHTINLYLSWTEENLTSTEKYAIAIAMIQTKATCI